MKSDVLLRTENLQRHFQDGTRTIEVLRGVDFVLHRSERVAIVGQSGSGKSTLLHLLGLLDTPTGGGLTVGEQGVVEDGRPVPGLTPHEIARIRNEEFGFVFQAYHLLSDFNATENVEMPAQIGDVAAWRAKRGPVRERAHELLRQVGLEDRLSAYPATLSGGEKQRVAIARALVNDPEILLFDEPTGNLDEQTSREIFDLLDRMHEQKPFSAVIVTHETDLAGRCDRVIRLDAGKLAEM